MVESNSVREEKEYTPIPPQKAYAIRMKRHDESILALHSPEGMAGDHLITAAADEHFRIWNMAEQQVSGLVPFQRPADSYLLKFKNMANGMGLIKLIEDNHSNEPDQAFTKEE